ncbi:FbpB family small basic protein [Caldifermentibacillus hisashii]|uniref:FbpB family small basic protein n=1 Tax=Caldifermentibacillus hisashii TaxID=996558 RepID=UPI000BA4CF98|nr:FbpB family small basic protein [Caldifermentibacillus hisashii]PAC37782.1 FbpB family small basic protein [Caldifermentibacillus hisashii]
MGKSRNRSFSELVKQNKSQILKDQEIMEKIERKIEEKQIKKGRINFGKNVSVDIAYIFFFT